jgi:thiol-disulfide isomerase/thioredoxin
MTKQWIFVGLVVAGLAGGALIMTQLGDEVKPVAVGSVAPDFKAIDLATGDSVSLHERYRGKVTLINIWATWCAPCRREMPSLDRLQATLGEDGLTVIALSLDRGDVAKVRAFFEELQIANLAIYQDPQARAGRALGAPGLPTTIVIDRTGQEVGRLLGPAEWDSEEALALLRDLAAPSGAAD